jgi:hypothetical protein
MRISRLHVGLVATLGLFSLSIPATASTFNFSGVISQDDSLVQFQFTTAGLAQVQIQTFSYGGNGTNISAGGFAPVLTLFGPLPSGDPGWLGDSTISGCGSGLADTVTTECADASLTAGASGPLAAGTYLVVLSQFGNVSNNGFDLDGGFSQTGNPTYTAAGILSGPFVDPDGIHQRTGAWAVQLGGDVTAANLVASPEPATLWSLLAGLGLLAAFALTQNRRARRTA